MNQEIKFRWAERKDEEIDPNQPGHAREHEEFHAEGTNLLDSIVRVVSNAPCPGGTLSLLEAIENTVAVLGMAGMATDMMRKQRGQDQTPSPADLNDESKPLPDIFGGLFRADGTLNPDF